VHYFFENFYSTILKIKPINCLSLISTIFPQWGLNVRPYDSQSQNHIGGQNLDAKLKRANTNTSFGGEMKELPRVGWLPLSPLSYGFVLSINRLTESI